MGKNSNSAPITVGIQRELYYIYKARAEAEKSSMVDFFNELLINLLEKEKFVRSVVGFLEIVGPEGDRMTLMDTKNRKLIDVYLRDFELYCEQDQSNNCIHTRFVWASPQMGKLIRSKKKGGTLDSAGGSIPTEHGKGNGSSTFKALLY